MLGRVLQVALYRGRIDINWQIMDITYGRLYVG
jgi:hypothetical protein